MYAVFGHLAGSSRPSLATTDEDASMQVTATEQPSTTDIEVRTALAMAVATDPHPAALLLDAGNQPAGTAPIKVAVVRGQACAVKVASRLVAIDHDNVGADYGETVAALQEARVEYVELASGGAEHRRHLWVALGDVDKGARDRIVAGCAARGVDVRSGGSRMRPPLECRALRRRARRHVRASTRLRPHSDRSRRSPATCR
jgi:hypothetical protein